MYNYTISDVLHEKTSPNHFYITNKGVNPSILQLVGPIRLFIFENMFKVNIMFTVLQNAYFYRLGRICINKYTNI